MGDTRVSSPISHQAQAGATQVLRQAFASDMEQPDYENSLERRTPSTTHKVQRARILCLVCEGNSHGADRVWVALHMCWNDFRLKRRSALLSNERSLEPTLDRAGPGPLARS